MSTQFANDNAGRLVHISEVERGLTCGCVCVVCRERMVAKKGAEREHHFAHESNKQECAIGHETLLHKFGKRVIQEEGGVSVPWSAPPSPRWLMFDRVEEETRLGMIRPDIVGYSGDDPVLIEIAYSSFADSAKTGKIQALGLRALEIDLHRLHPENFDPATAKHAILHDVANKKWLVGDQGKPSYTEEKLVIHGIWVFLRFLRYGDLAIRVAAFNPEVNAIVKAVAKRYWGRWQPKYKNWVIPQRWVWQAAEDIRAAADRPEAGAAPLGAGKPPEPTGPRLM